MSLINHEELKKQLASGEITSLDDITAEFKNMMCQPYIGSVQ